MSPKKSIKKITKRSATKKAVVKRASKPVVKPASKPVVKRSAPGKRVTKPVKRSASKPVVKTQRGLGKLARTLSNTAPKTLDTRKVKKVAKQIKKESKQVSRTIKTTTKQVKEIGKALRDAFGRYKSKPVPKPVSKKHTTRGTGGRFVKQVVTPAKVAPKKAQKKAAKKASKKQAKKQKVFKLERVRARKGENLIQFFDRVENDADSINASIGEDERIIFSYKDGKSKRSYPDVQSALAAMRAYDLSKRIAAIRAEEDAEFDRREEDFREYDGEDEEDDEILLEDEPASQAELDLVDSIHFMRSAMEPRRYSEMRATQTEARKKERLSIRKEAKKVTGLKKGSNIDLVKALLEINKKKGK